MNITVSCPNKQCSDKSEGSLLLNIQIPTHCPSCGAETKIKLNGDAQTIRRI